MVQVDTDGLKGFHGYIQLDVFAYYIYIYLFVCLFSFFFSGNLFMQRNNPVIKRPLTCIIKNNNNKWLLSLKPSRTLRPFGPLRHVALTSSRQHGVKLADRKQTELGYRC